MRKRSITNPSVPLAVASALFLSVSANVIVFLAASAFPFWNVRSDLVGNSRVVYYQRSTDICGVVSSRFARSVAIECYRHDTHAAVFSKYFSSTLDRWLLEAETEFEEKLIDPDRIQYDLQFENEYWTGTFILCLNVWADFAPFSPPAWAVPPSGYDGSRFWQYSQTVAYGWPLRFVSGTTEVSLIDHDRVSMNLRNVQCYSSAIVEPVLSQENFPPGAARLTVVPYRISWIRLLANVSILTALQLLIILLFKTWTSRSRVVRGRCRQCGYCGASSDVCPECGTIHRRMQS